MFYYTDEGKLMAVSVRSGESPDSGTAIPLFEFRTGTNPGFPSYEVAADGKRFLINTVVETEPNAPLSVVVNWMVR